MQGSGDLCVCHLHYVLSFELYCCFQVDANGCIFLWKLPVSFSSKIVWSVEKLFLQLSPIIKDPPIALSRIKFFEGDDSLCKANTVDEAALQYSKVNHVGQGMSCQGGNPEGSTTFKFSVSRLPKWAQDKVTECGTIPTRSECSLLQVVLKSVKVK